MNTTSGKVRLATYEEVKKIMNNGAGGRLVWSGTLYSQNNGKSITIPVECDYAVVYAESTNLKRYMMKGYWTKLGKGDTTWTIRFSPDNMISASVDYAGTSVNITVIIEAYKYD